MVGVLKMGMRPMQKRSVVCRSSWSPPPPGTSWKKPAGQLGSLTAARVQTLSPPACAVRQRLINFLYSTTVPAKAAEGTAASSRLPPPRRSASAQAKPHVGWKGSLLIQFSAAGRRGGDRRLATMGWGRRAMRLEDPRYSPKFLDDSGSCLPPPPRTCPHFQRKSQVCERGVMSSPPWAQSATAVRLYRGGPWQGSSVATEKLTAQS